MTTPSSMVPKPGTLWPPPRTARSRPFSRAKSTAAITSPASRSRTTTLRPPVDHRVVDLARLVVPLVVGRDDLAANALAQLVHGESAHRLSDSPVAVTTTSSGSAASLMAVKATRSQKSVVTTFALLGDGRRGRQRGVAHLGQKAKSSAALEAACGAGDHCPVTLERLELAEPLRDHVARRRARTGAWPVRARMNGSLVSEKSSASVSAVTVPLRGTSSMRAISPKPSLGPASFTVASVPGDLQLAGGDGVEAVAGLALADHRGARGDVERLEGAGQALELGRRQRREDRHEAQQLDLHPPCGTSATSSMLRRRFPHPRRR